MAKVKFGDIVKEVKNNVDRANNPYEFYVAGDHMDSEDLNIRRRGRFATDDVGPAFIRIFKPGQILYGSRRTYLKKVAVADFEGICSNTTFVLETKDENKFHQGLLPFVMLSDEFTKWSVSHSKGSTNPYILFSDLANYEFELPPIDEQKRLAEKLWAAYEVKQSYLNMIAATDEMVKAQFVEMFSSTPKVCVNSLVDTNWGTSPDSSSYNENGIGMPFYQGKTEFGDLYINAPITFCSSPIKIAKRNDILMSVRAPVGAVNIATQDCCIGRGLAAITPKNSKATTMFIYYSLKYMEKEIERLGTGSTFKAINKNSYAQIYLPEASMPDQQKFVQIAEQADASKAALRKSIEAIDKVIKSLINENL